MSLRLQAFRVWRVSEKNELEIFFPQLKKAKTASLMHLFLRLEFRMSAVKQPKTLPIDSKRLMLSGMRHSKA